MTDTLYEYDSLGRLTVTCFDVDSNGAIDYAGSDRINRIDRIYEERSGEWWQVTYNEVWAQTNSATSITSSISRVRMTGLGTDTYNGAILTAQSESVDWLGNVTRTSTYTDSENATVWIITDTPDSDVDSVQKSVAGYPVQSISSTAITNSFIYDGFARQVSAINGRSNTIVTAYNNLGQVSYTQNSTNQTHYFYDSQGRQTSVSNALGQVSHTAYDPQDHTIAEWGTSYPVAYQFDTAGRMIAMATTRSNDYANVNLNTLVSSGDTLNDCNVAGLDITQWIYNESTGLLISKLYADGNGTAYTYTDSGRLSTRTWARGPVTTYSYDSLGQLSEVDYSLWTTPDVTYTHDRLGRILSAISTASTNLFAYTGLALDSETQNSWLIDYTQDFLGRTAGYVLTSPGGSTASATVLYSYSDNGRFYSVESIHGITTNTFTYNYLDGTDLINGYTLTTGGTAPPLSVTRSYENDRNFITAVTNAWNSFVLSSYTYLNDPLGRRTKRTDYFNSLLSTNVFDYNIFGELIEVSMNSGTDIYNIDYDPIGNRTQFTVDSLLSSVTNVYVSNQLNQYTSVDSVTSVVYPAHDLDGNQTYNGSEWYHTWDAENRLICSSNETTGVVCTYEYDYQNRRIFKTTLTPDPYSTLTSKYIWHDWNIIAELISTNASSFSPHNSSLYTWGLDLSGTLQGAGGVGGLLSDTKVTSTSTNVFYSFCDGNGNVTEYIAGNGDVKAHYEYSATGEETYKSGSMADDFTHRFSTKPFDPQTGLLQYEQRPYDPILNRPLSRDPIGELSFNENRHPKTQIVYELNSYLFCENSALTIIDPDGAMARPLIDRRHPPKNKKLIKVPRCSILIMYGHHFQNPEHSRHGEGFENIWNIVPKSDEDKGYAYAGIITCMAAAVPNEIPLPGYAPVSAQSELDVDAFGLKDTDMSIEWGKIKIAATKAAKKLCKKCCRKKKIHVEVDSYGLNFGEHMKMPCEFSWDVTCDRTD